MNRFNRIGGPGGFLVGGALLWAILYLVVPAATLIPVLNGLLLGGVVAASFAFVPLLRAAFLERDFDRIAQLTLGIVLAWTSLGLSRLANAYGRWIGDMNAAGDSWIVSVAAFVGLMSAFLHVSAPSSDGDGKLRHKGLIYLGGVLGVVIAIVVIIMQDPPAPARNPARANVREAVSECSCRADQAAIDHQARNALGRVRLEALVARARRDVEARR